MGMAAQLSRSFVALLLGGALGPLGAVALRTDPGVMERIPDWKLHQVLGPVTPAPTLGGDEAGQPLYALDLSFGSSLGQDRRKCPVVKLPKLVSLRPRAGGSTGLSGTWDAPHSGVSMASFGQNYFSQSWDMVSIRNLDQRLALKAEIKSETQLEYLYGWTTQEQPLDNKNISDLEDLFAQASATGMAIPGGKASESSETLVSLTDCEERLMFVVRFSSGAAGQLGGIDVYDVSGKLVVHALADPSINKYQFINPLGKLLAVAESPGIHQNVSIKDMPRDPEKGNVLPFEMQFVGEGYSDASPLVEPEKRWILALVMQMRAIQDAQNNWTPGLPKAMMAIYWVIFVVGLLALLSTCVALHRVVYARTSSSKSAAPTGPKEAAAGPTVATYTRSPPVKIVEM